jgi:hypothetical protein
MSNLSNLISKLSKASAESVHTLSDDKTSIFKYLHVETLVEKAWLTFGGSLAYKLNPFLSAFNTYTLDLLKQWEITMDNMGKATEEGAKEISEGDMDKILAEYSQKLIQLNIGPRSK